ncbi:ribonuclease P protein subunit p40-like [Saccostrea echinata]|uniref:ribonuclease P protein subunit p40-like n=1 Tax=Saccostrea echinata TaxID=191078 RepID=UPI002A820E10|nr:ribonuclease P protein subunit p40-like [Saccostrea echinata]
MAASIKKSTLKENLKINTFNIDNEEKIKWISGLSYMKHSIGVTITHLETFPSNIIEICEDELSYIVYNLPVHELINPDLLGAFQQKGSLCMLSFGTRLEVNDCVAFLPTGHLILHLRKDLYTRLGLEGKPSQYNKYGGEKYVVEIDVGSTVFTPGKKNYEKVRQCLLRVNMQCDFLVTWTPQDENLCASSIHKYFRIKDFNCVHLPVSSKTHKYTDVDIPDLQHQDVDNHTQEELYDWLGGVANQISLPSESDEAYNPLSDYSGPTRLGHCSHFQISGLFSSATVQNLIQEIRKMCKSCNTWACLTIHGFTDSPTSLGRSEKNPHKLCADSATLVILPSDRCWLFTDT